MKIKKNHFAKIIAIIFLLIMTIYFSSGVIQSKIHENQFWSNMGLALLSILFIIKRDILTVNFNEFIKSKFSSPMEITLTTLALLSFLFYFLI